jgi:hypothetical protein
MPSQETGRIGWRPASMMVLTVLAVASVQHYRDDVHYANEASRIYAAMAVALHGTPVLDPVFDRYFPGWRSASRPPNVDVAVFRDRYHLDKAPGISLLAVPGIWLIDRLGLEIPFRWIAWGFAVLLCAIPSGLLGWLASRRLERAGLPGWPAWAAVLATPWLAYGGMLFGHALAAALVGAALVLGLGPLGPEKAPDHPAAGRREAILGGVAAGMATLVEYPAAFWVALVVLVLAASPGHRSRLPWFLLGGLPLAGALLAWNAWNFESPFALSYAFKSNADLQAIHGQGAFGFTAPSWERLAGLCLGSRRGLFFAAPWLLSGILGAWVALADDRMPRPWRLALPLGCWGWPLFVSGFVDWTAGMTFGPRHLLAGLPALALAAAVAFRRWPGRLPRALAAAWVLSSLLLNAAAAWTFPYAHPEVRNPLGEVMVPVLIQAGTAPMVWDAWLPAPLGALLSLASALGVLALAWQSPAPSSPSARPSRAMAGALAAGWFALHLASALGVTGTPEEVRAAVRNRALAFEMLGREDLAAAARRSLQASPEVPAP